jgi:hypothetical protein
MTDWKKIGSALDPPIPAADLEQIAPVLEALEEAFRPLRESIPHDAGVWTGPGNVT